MLGTPLLCVLTGLLEISLICFIFVAFHFLNLLEKRDICAETRSSISVDAKFLLAEDQGSYLMACVC